jgi:GH25 family lysozyme M1 (1,4-beta-N-acetylmuramidase)
MAAQNFPCFPGGVHVPAQALRRIAFAAFAATAGLPAAKASDFSAPWNDGRALVVDAYEYNSIDWGALASDKRVVGFIAKASDGLPPPYSCSGDETAVRLCKALWKRHAVARELFQTRRVVAKALGLEWGAYHLARPGNPVEQADNFVDFADPAPDDLLALDLEDNDPSKWMSLDDAEEFVRQLHRRVGRFPLLYTNETTARHIAENRGRYRLLSRLPLWYARYKPDIGDHFPKGNWHAYTLWQFSAQANCGRLRCPYRVAGTPLDIDVNVAAMSGEELRAAWPFGKLVDAPADYLASVPVPVARERALKGDVTIAYADVAPPPDPGEIVAALGKTWKAFVAGFRVPTEIAENPYREGMAEYAVAKLEQRRAMLVAEAPSPGIDPIVTGTAGPPAVEHVNPRPSPARPRASRYHAGKSPAASRSGRPHHKPSPAHHRRKRR